MRRFLFLACGVASLAAVVPAHAANAAKHVAPAGNLTAAQIVERNVAARGGLPAWHAVKTLTFSGKLEAGGKTNAELPFVLKMKRQHKSRLEISFQEETALQVYDGKHGWKVRPFLGRDEVEPFTPAEVRAAEDWQELDGPLIDYAKKGTKVRLLGKESIEGHPAYKLKLTMKDGAQRHVWVDAATFLELRIDGEPRKMDGKMHNVSVYYRDYKAENGLTVPHVFETVVEGGPTAHKMSIDQVIVNQPMEDIIFAKPQVPLVRSSLK